MPLHQWLMRDDCGGVVLFEGRVRDHHDGKAVTHLSYQAYSELALSEGTRVIEEVAAEFGVHACAVHAVGDLLPGDLAVWVGVAAGHRGDAFTACQALIDAIKARVPVWKYETYADGSTIWVDPTAGG